MLEVKNITSGYGRKIVNSSVSFSIKKNNLTVILGPNGCGKTTLLKTICGVLNNKNGEIYIDDVNIRRLSLKEKAKKIAYMPQIRHIPDMTVMDFISCARYPHTGITKSYSLDDLMYINNAIEKAGIQEYTERKLCTLSGGERQKVYLAMALCQDTEIILLDEPVTYLDIEKQFDIMNLIKNLKQNKTILMVCHDIRLSLKYADNFIVMDKGKVLKEGTKEEILASGILEKVFNIKIEECKLKSGYDYIINSEK